MIQVAHDEKTHVGTIALDRVPHNYLSAAVLAAVVRAARDLDAEGCRALVLRANGRNFCVGAELGDGQDPNAPDARHIYDVAVELFEIDVPIVAAVHGKAIGAGVGLALVADLRVAAPDAQFTANFTRLGISHGFGMSVTLPRAVGAGAAAELLYTGRAVPADEALALGLVDRIAADPAAEATELAGQIAANAPLAVRSARRLLRGTLAAEVAAALRGERAAQETEMRTGDFREGVRAAKDRRPPVFEGS
ncbi:enoyl-CoA hydratase/isomerase family protein [Pseudonocardia ailaonensis]|uniref:Enoyl-CoA hydratase/isomerase family protein n=1 Tax=Pseudonocardia ailaonensis TaxID=367279 RepID=A0ABN2NGX7_9PSEU